MLAPLAASVATVSIGALAARVHAFGQRPPALPASPRIAVILGARVFSDGTPSDALVDRVALGVSLLESGKASCLLLSGGSPDARPAEAQVALELAARAGVPADRCLVETKSRSTFDNARYSAAMLRELGEREVIIVTCDFHLLRATSHFRAQGLTVFPVPSPRRLTRVDRLVATGREVTALLRRPWLIT